MSDYPIVSTVSSGWAGVYHYPAEFKTTQQLDEEAMLFMDQVVLTFDMYLQAHVVRWESMTMDEKRLVFSAFREAVISDATTSWAALVGRDDILGTSRYHAAINTLHDAHDRLFRMRHQRSLVAAAGSGDDDDDDVQDYLISESDGGLSFYSSPTSSNPPSWIDVDDDDIHNMGDNDMATTTTIPTFYDAEFQAVAVRRLENLFDMGAVKYHQYMCTLNMIIARRGGTNVDAGGAIDEWVALTYDEQRGVYREFQGVLEPSCQQHLNTLATEGWLHPDAIDELMGQLQGAESYINHQIEKLLYGDDDALSWTFSEYSEYTDEGEDEDGTSSNWHY